MTNVSATVEFQISLQSFCPFAWLYGVDDALLAVTSWNGEKFLLIDMSNKDITQSDRCLKFTGVTAGGGCFYFSAQESHCIYLYTLEGNAFDLFAGKENVSGFQDGVFDQATLCSPV